jgi:hypothetical protein
MSQDFQSLGKPSTSLETVANRKNGWDTQAVEPLITERTDGSDYSAYDIRSNRQALGLTISNMASHTETPTAAQPVTPYDPFQAGS